MSAAMNTNTADSSSSSSAQAQPQPPPRQSSATSTVAGVPMTSTSNIASVHFKVRCERLGHGEDVYLTPLEEYEDAAMNPVTIAQLLLQPPSPTNRHKMIPLYTTATEYPWYSTLSSLPMPVLKIQKKASPLSPAGAGGGGGTGRTLFANKVQSSSSKDFRYRYAVFRAGVFHRWEEDSDENYIPSTEDTTTTTNTSANQTSSSITNTASNNNDDVDVDVDDMDVDNVDTPKLNYHALPLRFLAASETYVVNDVLGKRRGQRPDIYHKRISGDKSHYIGVEGSGACGLGGSDNDNDAAESAAAALGGASLEAGGGKLRKKSVGFAPPPPPMNESVSSNSKHHKRQASGEQVHLNSTDGLVVVSAFLPVVVHRCETSTQAKWTADWDYEALLSMQTHLRVTRVGVVKWKGWHGNYGQGNTGGGGAGAGQDGQEQPSSTTSEEYGVPISERYLVEECLRPFQCVPVWIDPLIFGEMYNGFCKGILWPILHNSTGVYASHKKEDDEQAVATATARESSTAQDGGQFSELCRDDVQHGPIHGGRGREKKLWSAYNQVNRKFSEVVVQCFNEGDLVWIHGFHLLILPSYLTRRISMAKIGLFLHTPFPSSEIFRTLWCREDLLRGMLNADQVGFHLFEYARHFLTCCRRLLGLNYGMIPDASGNGGYSLAIDTNGRHVAVTSIHAGIEPPVLHQILKHDSVLREAIAIRQRHPGKTIFCSIDRLESLKGIPLKILAMERFLKRCPEWIGKLVLIQVGITAWERGDDYIKTRDEVTEMVHRINNLYPGTVIFQEAPDWQMRLQQRLALMKASDVVLVTPIRDGLNLIPLEFTIVHQDALTPEGQKDGRRRGLVILSEFASCTRVMRGALHVNPWKISEIAFAFKQALTMSDEERLKRVTCASEFVTRVTTQRWALAVMLDLKGVHKSVNPVQYSGAGLGLGFRLLGMDSGFDGLEFKAVAKAYKISSRRLILFDYGGTITSNENLDNLSRFRMVKTRSHHSEPTAEMINTIQELCKDKKNTVFVVSGKERHSLITTLGHIPNLGLAAEHGMYISWPETVKDGSRSSGTTGGFLSSPFTTSDGGGGMVPSSSHSSSSHGSKKHKKHKRHWDTLVPIADSSWRVIAMSIMEVYASRTHGSYIEETEMKVLWQYRDADLEFGYLQARELEDHLSNVLRSYPIDILHGGMEEGGFVEVRPKGVNKGVFAQKVIRNFDKFVSPGSNARIDFALVLGDDHCDEPMLSVMRQIGHRAQGGRSSELPTKVTLVDVSACDANISGDLECFTCTVGKKPSAAANYLQDVNEVEELLEALVKVSKNPNASKSMMDLMMESAAAEAVLPPMDMTAQAQVSAIDTTAATGKRDSAFMPGSIGDYFDGIDDEEEDIFF